MQLMFYRIPIGLLESLNTSDISLFFYHKELSQRTHVTEASFNELYLQAKENEQGYFQLLVSDIDLIQDSKMIQKIIFENKELSNYCERYNQRWGKYSHHFRPWTPAVELASAINNNNFTPLFNLIQADLANDQQDISAFATSVSDCLEKILIQDSNFSRMIAFCVCCFKYLKYSDRTLLYDFLGAAILKDIGLSQAYEINNKEDNEIFFKHPYYSLFLLKKIPFTLTQQSYFFILDHHENADGSGFPRTKTSESYHPLCDVLKCTEEMFLKNNESEDIVQILSRQISLENESKINPALYQFLKTLAHFLANSSS